MAVKRNFTFPMSTLLYEADLILTAAEDKTSLATKRLKKKLLKDSRNLLGQLSGKGSSAQAQKADVSELTQKQNDAIVDLLELFGNLKTAAKEAFKGQDVKLRDEFQVTINSPNDLASILNRARKAGDASKKAENTGPLKDKGGWIADDSTKLDASIKAVGDIDKDQQSSQVIQIAGTDARNTAANTLNDNLRTIQSAANLEWPEKDPNNRASRESFRIGIFPPSGGSSSKGKTSPAGTSGTPPKSTP